MNIGPQEVSVALKLMGRAPLTGDEAKAVAVTIDKFEKWLEVMVGGTIKRVEEPDGDDAESAEQST